MPPRIPPKNTLKLTVIDKANGERLKDLPVWWSKDKTVVHRTTNKKTGVATFYEPPTGELSVSAGFDTKTPQVTEKLVMPAQGVKEHELSIKANHKAIILEIIPGTPPPTYPGQLTVEYAVYFGADATSHAKDRCNLYTLEPRGSQTCSLGPTKVVIPISDEEFESDAVTLFLWARPTASATFRKDAQSLAVGRLRLTESDIKFKGCGMGGPRIEAEIDFSALIVESPIIHLVHLLKANLKHPAVLDMRGWNSSGVTGQGADTMTTLGFPAEWKDSLYLRLLRAGHLATSNAAYAEEMSLFDLKPEFGKIWGTANRITNDDRIYYYDVWSNMHYGFIGAASRFDLQSLLDMSGSDPRRGDSSGDIAATTFGHNLFQRAVGALSDDGEFPWILDEKTIFDQILAELQANDAYLDKKYLRDTCGVGC